MIKEHKTLGEKKPSVPNILRWRKVTGLKDPQLNNTTLVFDATVPQDTAILNGILQSIPKYRLAYTLPLVTTSHNTSLPRKGNMEDIR